MAELLAPNEKPSNLTPEQYKLVRTEAFKKWFGDWENNPANASKVVDSNGEPLVVYHGSNVDFNVFEKSKTNPYAQEQGYFFAFDKKYAESHNSKYVKPFFINIRIRGTFDDDDNLVPFNADGTIVEGLHVEVYDKKNIKLADGTNTTFDGKNPDIRFDGGGEITNYKEFFDKLKIENGSKYVGKKFGEIFPFLANRVSPVNFRNSVKLYNGILSRLENNNYSTKSMKTADLNKLERTKKYIDKKKYLSRFYLDPKGNIISFDNSDNAYAKGGEIKD